MTEELFAEFLQDCPVPRFVGLAPIYSERGALCRLAIAVSTRVLIVQFHAKGKGKNAYLGREILQSQLLHNSEITLLAFDMNKLAIALFKDQDIRIFNGVDIQSACGSSREPLAAIEFAAQERVSIMKSNVTNTFQSSVFDAKRTTSFALQAWVAHCLSTFDGMEERFRSAKMINTKEMNDYVRRAINVVSPALNLIFLHHHVQQLHVLAQLERGEQRIELTQSTSVAHEFNTNSVRTRDGTATVQAQRFQTRFHQHGGEGQTRVSIVFSCIDASSPRMSTAND